MCVCVVLPWKSLSEVHDLTYVCVYYAVLYYDYEFMLCMYPFPAITSKQGVCCYLVYEGLCWLPLP